MSVLLTSLSLTTADAADIYTLSFNNAVNQTASPGKLQFVNLSRAALSISMPVAAQQYFLPAGAMIDVSLVAGEISTVVTVLSNFPGSGLNTLYLYYLDSNTIDTGDINILGYDIRSQQRVITVPFAGEFWADNAGNNIGPGTSNTFANLSGLNAIGSFVIYIFSLDVAIQFGTPGQSYLLHYFVQPCNNSVPQGNTLPIAWVGGTCAGNIDGQFRAFTYPLALAIDVTLPMYAGVNGVFLQYRTSVLPMVANISTICSFNADLNNTTPPPGYGGGITGQQPDNVFRFLNTALW